VTMNIWLAALQRLRNRISSPGRRKATKNRSVVLQCELLEERVVLDSDSAGPNGIAARALNLTLTGNNVRIGQVEQGRVGMRVRNGAAFDMTYHKDVTPADVFLKAGAPIVNEDVRPHPGRVAGVMIADGATDQGVARSALLYSSA